MIITFVTLSAPYPPGGMKVIYEYANNMRTRGHDVHLLHLSALGFGVRSLDEIECFPFADGIEHRFVDAITPDVVPSADFIGCFADTNPPRAGLPLLFVQGYKMLAAELEIASYRSPCPKICVGRWLVDVGRELGVPAGELVHIPSGLRHDVFRVVAPVQRRGRRVAFCYNPYFNKGSTVGLDVLAAVKRRVPELEAVLFGATEPPPDLPEWATYHQRPDVRTLVEDVFNTSAVFLFSSDVEGFGLPCIEAMACGCALVTTDNGGSRDYAIHDRTALVAPPRDVDALVDAVVALLRDDERRVRLADAGAAYVERFDWQRSAALLESFLDRYAADPAAYGRAAAAT